jgi:hypothetical protein
MRDHGKHHSEPEETPDVSYIANPDTKHEMTDVSASMLLKFIGVLVVGTMIILAAMKLMSNFLEQREQSLELPPASRVNPPGTQRLPPGPRLQGAPGSQELPMADMKTYLAEQNAKVQSYGWVNREAGIVRIPIDQAKKLVLERGITSATGSALTNPAAPGTAPSPSPSPAPPAKPAVGGAPATRH